jgi:D-glycero-D-manno-heptose 1,7-bisphosphate phosphatase
MPGKAVLLDRDGIINQSVVREGRPFPPNSLGDFRFVEMIHDSLETLKKRGYLLIIFTNQPDVARGTKSIAGVNVLNDYICQNLPIDKVYTCFHDNNDNCDCRKPKPGMILQAAKDYNLDLSLSYVVGDRWRDIDAGVAAGCKTVFVDYGYDESLRGKPDFTIMKVSELIDIIN